jgi:predicted phosphodiesterase
MNRLVISDTHLGRKFNKGKFDYLAKLFSSYDEIILNGDFWDYFSLTFDQFVNSRWSKLFPIMQNKTIYIYGNHDQEEWCDDRIKLFSRKQTNMHTLMIRNNKFIFRHGHKIDGFRTPDDNRFVKISRILRLGELALVLDRLLVGLNPNRNSKIETFAKDLNQDEYLFVGHKHIPSMDLSKRIMVGGWVLFGQSNYFVINSAGEIELKKEKY